MIRKLSLALAAAGLAVGSIVSAAPVPSRAGAPVTNANYQDDDGDNEIHPYFIGLVLIAAVILLTLTGGDDPSSP